VLVGATATGKTAVAQALAREHGWAVLSADAMQVYRGMDLGTAKPCPREREGIMYGGLDLADPDAPFSAGDYLRAVRMDWPRLATTPAILVVGGSGLYVRALIEGLEAPASTPAIRAEAERLLKAEGIEALRRAVRERAPEIEVAIRDPLNPRRWVRAYERAAMGAPSFRRRIRADRPVVVGLRQNPHALADRIRRRAQAMFEEGLLEEAKALRQRWGSLSPTAEKAIGYREAFDVLDGRCTREEAIERIVVRTRQYAKRQMTWFRHQIAVDWVDVEHPPPDEVDLAAKVGARMERHGSATLYGIG
jgi:tRNA dimethylallyltransferase